MICIYIYMYMCHMYVCIYIYIYIYIFVISPGDIAKGGLAKYKTKGVCSRTFELLLSPLLLCPLISAPNYEILGVT